VLAPLVSSSGPPASTSSYSGLGSIAEDALSMLLKLCETTWSKSASLQLVISYC